MGAPFSFFAMNGASLCGLGKWDDLSCTSLLKGVPIVQDEFFFSLCLSSTPWSTCRAVQ